MFKLRIGTLKMEFRLFKTSAPVEYDYAYCLPIYEGGGERYVLILDSQVAYQTARYSSGLYMWEEVPVDSEKMGWLEQKILRKVVQG